MKFNTEALPDVDELIFADEIEEEKERDFARLNRVENERFRSSNAG